MECRREGGVDEGREEDTMLLRREFEIARPKLDCEIERRVLVMRSEGGEERKGEKLTRHLTSEQSFAFQSRLHGRSQVLLPVPLPEL